MERMKEREREGKREEKEEVSITFDTRSFIS